MSNTRTEQTPHGDINYETFDCDGCGGEKVLTGKETELHELDIQNVHEHDTEESLRVKKYYTVYTFCTDCEAQLGPSARLALQKARYKQRLQVAYMGRVALFLLVVGAIWWFFL